MTPKLITYPVVTELAHMPMCTGRNGSVYTTAMKVSRVDRPAGNGGDVVILAPLTSRNTQAKHCDFEIPNDRAVLQAFADIFRDLALAAP